MTKLDYEPRRARGFRDGFPGWKHVILCVATCTTAAFAGAATALEPAWAFGRGGLDDLPCCGTVGALIFVPLGLGVLAMLHEVPMWFRHLLGAIIAFCGMFAATFLLIWVAMSVSLST